MIRAILMWLLQAAVYHPSNPAARLFAAIAGTKTLTLPTLKYIIALGYSIVYTHDHIPPTPQTDFHMEHA